MPYASEDPYFWSQMSADQLDLLQTTTPDLFIASGLDRAAKETQLQVRKEAYEPPLDVCRS